MCLWIINEFLKIIIKDFYSAHAKVQSAVQLYMNRKDKIKMTKTTKVTKKTKILSKKKRKKILSLIKILIK